MKRIVWLVIIFTYLMFHWLYLEKFPLIWGDEATYVESAANFVNSGNFSSKLYGPMAGFDRSNVVYGRLYLLSRAIAFKIFGINIFAARIISLSFGLLLIWLCYLFGKKNYSTSFTAILMTVFLATSYTFFLLSHDARPEIMAVTFLLLSLNLYLLAEEKDSRLLLFLSSLVATLTADIHLNGVLAVFVLAAVILIRRQMLKLEKIWPFAAGIFAGVIWWTSAHILPDPKLFFYQYQNIWQPWLPSPIFIGSGIVGIIKNELTRYWNYFWLGRYHRNIFLLCLFVAGIYQAIKSKDRPAVLNLSIIFTIVFFFTLFVGNKTTYYLIYLLPFLYLLLANWCNHIFRNRKSIGYLVIALILAYNLIHLCYIGKEFSRNYYRNFCNQLQKYIPADGAIIGQTQYWFAFPTQDYYGDLYMISWTNPGMAKIHSEIGNDFASVADRLKLKYLIMSEAFGWFLPPEKKQNIDNYLQKNGQLIATIVDRYYGGANDNRPGEYKTKIYLLQNSRRRK